MIEKIGIIKNPLTIIAIFAGIAEVSGTIVLPFVDKVNQTLFIYFLISFPVILVLFFFVTLNFNNKVLYAPSDYKDEQNYVRINRYDMTRKKSVEVKVQELGRMNNTVENYSIELLSRKMGILEENYSTDRTVTDIDLMLESTEYKFWVSNFSNVNGFIARMATVDVHFEVYISPGEDERTQVGLMEHRAIWLGVEIPLKLAQKVINKAREYYPRLCYVDLYYDIEATNGGNVFYVGGATESAKNLNLKPCQDKDFDTLDKFNDLGEFHQFIERFKIT
jgi:hypothetical protein